jgi:hypothetical protein
MTSVDLWLCYLFNDGHPIPVAGTFDDIACWPFEQYAQKLPTGLKTVLVSE